MTLPRRAYRRRELFSPNAALIADDSYCTIDVRLDDKLLIEEQHPTQCNFFIGHRVIGSAPEVSGKLSQVLAIRML